MKENEDEIINRLKEELASMKESESKIKELAQRSFVQWSHREIPAVARGSGYLIVVAKEKLQNIYNWLFNGK